MMKGIPMVEISSRVKRLLESHKGDVVKENANPKLTSYLSSDPRAFLQCKFCKLWYGSQTDVLKCIEYHIGG